MKKQSMKDYGCVKKEEEVKIFGKILMSRGFYIVDMSNHRLYLHQDGEIRDGVKSGQDEAAFWPTEESATKFFEDWKSNLDKYSQGVCEYGAAILKNGEPMTVEEILEELRGK